MMTMKNKEIQTEELTEMDEEIQSSDDGEDQHQSDDQHRVEKRTVNQVAMVSTPAKPQPKPTQHKHKVLFHPRSGAKNRDLKAQIQSLRRQVGIAIMIPIITTKVDCK